MSLTGLDWTQVDSVGVYAPLDSGEILLLPIITLCLFSLLAPRSSDSSRDFGLSTRTANTISVWSVRLSILVSNLFYQFSHLSGSS